VSFDGLFDGRYNRLDLVTDMADQVVCVSLVDETPRDRDRAYWRPGEWLTYNFVGYGVMALSTMKVEYLLEDLRSYRTSQNSPAVYRWEAHDRFMPSNATATSLRRVNTRLLDKDGKVKELTRWYVPKPLADLILHCVSKGLR
jgi:hypothetical protein